MAFFDNTLVFSSLTAGQQVTATANSTVIDLTGAGSGNAPSMINGFPASNTAIGFDIGAGDGEAIPYLYLSVKAKGTNSGSLTIALQAAPDNGSYSPGTYTQLWISPSITANNLVVGDSLLVPVPPTLFNFPSEALPRFYRVVYTVTGTVDLTFVAGLILNPPSTLLLGQYNNNFVVV
jgi:hypothetical protein